jgi:diacylglycerol kinase family enzyme
MPESGFLAINPQSGDNSPTREELAAHAQARGIDVHVLAVGEDAADAARASRAPAIGVAGGDGSLGGVAAVALERDVPFVCIPFGTRNHFARDLGLDPDDPLAALDAYSGVERRIDIARAGDRVFLNNLSIGLYAGLVHRREHHRLRRGLLASGRALLRALEHRPKRLELDGEPVRGRLVLVANNEYELSLFALGRRERLDEGVLHLYIAEGVLPTHWERRSGTRFRLDSAGVMRAALDGDPVDLEPPVEVEVRPGALRVLVPGEPR